MKAVASVQSPGRVRALPQQDRLRFGMFEADPARCELRRQGVPVRLPPQPFKALCLLAGRAGEVVTREELRREIWGESTFVDFDGGLNFCIKQVRQALGDDAASPRFLQTLRGRGYCFIGAVEVVGDDRERVRDDSVDGGGWRRVRRSLSRLLARWRLPKGGRGRSMSPKVDTAGPNGKLVPMPPRTDRTSALILVVDDVDDNLDAYSQYLLFRGYQVALAGDGEDALRQAAELRPDVIVMDLSLPLMDGWEATRRLKADDRTKSIPVIALTGHVQPESKRRALEVGCAVFLAKPCAPDELTTTIERVLRG